MGSEEKVLLEILSSEIKRIGDSFDKVVQRLEDKDEKQDEKIDQLSKFMNRAIGTVGSLSFIAILASAVTAVLTFFFR